MKIQISPFKGQIPKMSAPLLPNDNAQSANNANLETGAIASFRKPSIEKTLSVTGIESFFKYIYGVNKEWVTSSNILNSTRSPLSNDTYERAYFTGETQPRYFANDYLSDPFDASADYIKMGIPTPAAAPDYDSGHTGDSNYVAHFYTYVNRYGVEGPHSPVVSASTWDGSTSIVLSGFTEATEGHACNSENDGLSPKIRLYRTASSSAGVAAFQFVKDTTVNDTTNYATLTITDDVAAADLGEVCPSIYWYAPDSNMVGLIAMSNGVFAGFYGNTLYFSDPYLPEAWPTSYEITFSETIIGIGQYGTAVVVCTDESPYIVYGSHPSNMAKQKLDGFYPCESRQGIVSTEFGVFYPSTGGICLVNSNGVKNITKDILTQENMDDLNPSLWKAGFHNGVYIAFYYSDSTDYGGVHFNTKDNIFAEMDIYRNCVFSAYDDGKFYVEGIYDASDSTEYIQEWEGDQYNYLKYTWKSKRFLLTKPVNLSTARVIIDPTYYSALIELIDDNEYIETLNSSLFTADLLGDINAAEMNAYAVNHDTLYRLSSINMSSYITFKLYVDTELKFTKLINNSNPFRLPSGFRGLIWEVQLEGYVPINKIEIASSIKEIVHG